MTSSTTSSDSNALPSFEKHGKVSVWCSTLSYDTIPDSYFEEDDQGLDAWAQNFNISQYDHENMETNGVASGTALVKRIIEDCSYSSGYGDGIIHKINKMGHSEVSWIILLFDFEYRNKITKIHEDDYVQYVGSFVYDMDAITLAEQDQAVAEHDQAVLEALAIAEAQEQEVYQTAVAESLEAESVIEKTKPKQVAVPASSPSSTPDPDPEPRPASGAVNPWLK
jgi:hypothetical protein